MATSCPAGQVGVIGPNGTLLCSGTQDHACANDLVPAQDATGAWLCVPNPTTSCKVFIEYAPADPRVTTTPTLAGQPGCDQAGLELAVAVVLAKLLGSR